MARYSYMRFSTYPEPNDVDESGAVRFDGRYWWFLNHRRKGWASFGYCYSSMKTLLERWDVHLGELEVDEFGPHFPFATARGRFREQIEKGGNIL